MHLQEDILDVSDAGMLIEQQHAPCCHSFTEKSLANLD